MRTKLLFASLLLLLSTLAIPGTMAHAAAAPPTHETRLLHDHNDDSFVVLAGKHGFDAIALDAREAYDLAADEPTCDRPEDGDRVADREEHPSPWPHRPSRRRKAWS